MNQFTYHAFPGEVVVLPPGSQVLETKVLVTALIPPGADITFRSERMHWCERPYRIESPQPPPDCL